MTTREFYAAVISASISDDVTTFAAESIAKLDAKNAKRSSADSKEKKETAARRQLVLNYVTESESPVTREVIAEATGLTPGQVTAACTFYVKGGVFKKTEIKNGKSRTMAYEFSENSED